MRRPLKVAAVGIALSIASPAGAQRAYYPPDTLGPALSKAWSDFERGEATALEALYAGQRGVGPLVETSDNRGEHLVTFLWFGDAATRKVDLDGGLPAARSYPWNKDMFRLGESDLWYRTESMPSDSRFQYGFYVNAPYLEYVSARDLYGRFADEHPTQKDPLNPASMGNFSVLELPQAPDQPYALVDSRVPRGILNRDSLTSQSLEEVRRFTVYVPHGVRTQGEEYGLLLVFDGETFGTVPDSDVPLPTILNNLIARGRIPPTIAVLIDNQGTRERDLANNFKFAEFVADELIPWVDERFPVATDPADVTVAGFSSGGTAAAYLALTHPEAVGNVLAIAGWWAHHENNYETRFNLAPDYLHEPGWIIREFARRERLPVRFFIIVGRFDHYDANNIKLNRHMRDVLTARDYPLVYEEINSGHDRVAVPGMISRGLMSLAGGWGR